MSTILDEVLAANEDYAHHFGDRGSLALPRRGGSPSSPAWMPGSTRPSSPG
jgi:hypothetical protein